MQRHSQATGTRRKSKNGQAKGHGGGVGRTGVAADPRRSHLDPISRAMSAVRRRGDRGRSREGERSAARELAKIKAVVQQGYGPSKYTTYNQDRLDAHQARVTGRERSRAILASSSKGVRVLSPPTPGLPTLGLRLLLWTLLTTK